MKPRDILTRLEDVIGAAGAPRRLRDVIEHELRGHFGFLEIQAAETAERFELRVAELIIEKQNTADSQGTFATLSIIGSSGNVVVGSCREAPGDGAAVLTAKLNRLHAEPLLATMKTLSFADFERFGASVLRELGAQSVSVTAHSNDQGIDFFGVLNLGGLQNFPTQFFRLTHDVELRFAGQAKHYPTRSVGTATVRELIGSISLARSGTFSSDTTAFDSLRLKPFNPLLPLLFTTGTITAGAEKLASNAGIIARGGVQLAVFLADRGVGMVEAADGTRAFDQGRFQQWLDQT